MNFAHSFFRVDFCTISTSNREEHENGCLKLIVNDFRESWSNNVRIRLIFLNEDICLPGISDGTVSMTNHVGYKTACPAHKKSVAGPVFVVLNRRHPPQLNR